MSCPEKLTTERTPQHTPPRILCVDDDPDVARAMAILLSNFAVEVRTECCGRLAAVDAYEWRPDLIITDLRMREGDGQLLLSELRSNRHTEAIPVIVLTGQHDPQLPGRLRNLGAQGFLRKPVEPTLLLAEIERHLSLPRIDWASVGPDGWVTRRCP